MLGIELDRVMLRFADIVLENSWLDGKIMRAVTECWRCCFAESEVASLA